MKITPEQLRELAKSAQVFTDHFNAAADKVEQQNETLSVVADIAISRKDGELFRAVARYNDKVFINKIKADAIREAAQRISSGAIEKTHEYMIVKDRYCYTSTRSLRELADNIEGGEL